MERRTALAIAAATAGSVLAASAAFAANLGLLGHEDPPTLSVVDASAGQEPIPQEPTIVTVVVEDPPVSQANRQASTGAAATTATPTPSAAARSASDDVYDDDSGDDDHDDGYDDDRDDSHEDEDHGEVEDHDDDDD